LDQKIDEKYLLEENKSLLAKIAHFFTNTLRYAFFTPLYNHSRNKVYSMFGWNKEPEKVSWYSRVFGMSYNG